MFNNSWTQAISFIKGKNRVECSKVLYWYIAGQAIGSHRPDCFQNLESLGVQLL